MAQNIPIYIPTYISDAQYNPARVLPRIFFYNGQLECLDWYTADSGNVAQLQTKFPYFDNYNVITGSFPSEGSVSLLFNNEGVVYGNLPTASLFTEYWDTYVGLLYNPTTRLFACSAIIPLADYIKMELNDIVEWRGNYYHLRAINDYNLSNGECKLQLLGPLLPDILPEILPAIKNTTTTTTTTGAPTTTTTTTPPCAGCRSYTFRATGSGANVDLYWVDCEGTIQSILGLGDGDEVAVCSETSGSYPYYSASVGVGILSSCQATCSCDCYDFTQSYATGPYSYYPCSQAVGVGAPTYGQFVGVDIGTITCISSGSATIGITPLAPNTGSGGCTGCATTTTTTTTSTTTTTTTAAPTINANCYFYDITTYTIGTSQSVCTECLGDGNIGRVTFGGTTNNNEGFNFYLSNTSSCDTEDAIFRVAYGTSAVGRPIPTGTPTALKLQLNNGTADISSGSWYRTKYTGSAKIETTAGTSSFIPYAFSGSGYADITYGGYTLRLHGQSCVLNNFTASCATTTTTTTSTTTTTTTTAAPTTTTTTSTTSTTTTTTAAPTTTTTTEQQYSYINATRYLDCQQDSSPGAYQMRIPTDYSGSWYSGDDGNTYQFDSNQTPPTSYTITATAQFNSCPG